MLDSTALSRRSLMSSALGLGGRSCYPVSQRHAEEVADLDREAPRAGGAQPVGEDPLVARPPAGQEDRFA
jgi:hypothetical protein